MIIVNIHFITRVRQLQGHKEATVAMNGKLSD